MSLNEPPPSRVTALLTSPRFRFGILAIVVIAGIVVAFSGGGPDPRRLEALVEDTGPLAPLVYVVAYALLTVLLFPGSVLTATGGLLFGAVAATALTVVGATIGATGAFLIGRALGRGQVERIAGDRLERIDSWLTRRGFVAVLYARLLPIFPFNALNYASGVTGVRLRDYVIATAIGIIPGTFAFAALGGNLDDPTSPQFLGAVALVVALLVAGPFLAKRIGPDAPEDAGEDADAEGADAGRADDDPVEPDPQRVD